MNDGALRSHIYDATGHLMAQEQNSSSGQDQSHSANVAYYPKGAGGFGHIGIGIDTDNSRGYSTADPHVPWYKRIFGAPVREPQNSTTSGLGTTLVQWVVG